MWLEPERCWLSSRTYHWGLHLCQGLHWQFFVCLWKITRLAIFGVHCKICNFLQACKFLNSLQFSAIFPLLYKIYENCEKSEGWWFFAIICDFRSSLLCCSSSWKPDMDFTNFAKNLKVNDFLTWQNFYFLLQILQFLQLRANLDMSSFFRCQNKVGFCMVG